MLLRHALFVVAIALLSGTAAPSFESKTTPVLRLSYVADTTSQVHPDKTIGTLSRSLRAHDTERYLVNDAANEERVFKLPCCSTSASNRVLNLKTASEKKLKSILADDSKRIEVFKHLDDNDVNPQKVYIRLGGPETINYPVKETFWKEYLKWYKDYYYLG